MSRCLQWVDEGRYQSVIDLLGQKPTRSVDEQFLLEISRVRTTASGPDDLERLAALHPSHPMGSKAAFALATYYFNQGSFSRVKELLSQVNENELTRRDLSAYSFMNGFFALEEGANEDAKRQFDQAELFGYTDRVQLSYFQGVVSYRLNDIPAAKTYLESVKSDASYGATARYFLAKIAFDNSDYQEVIAISETDQFNDTSQVSAAFYQLVGETHAKLENATKASIFFDRSIALTPDQPSPALLYQAGVAAFKSGAKERAVNYFMQSGIKSGEYAWLSAFQLGRIYVSREEWALALAAYIEASNSTDPTIREESLFYAGKLQAQLRNYPEAISYLTDYLEHAQFDKWRTEVNDLLAEAYLRTSNYDQAIKHLDELGISTIGQQSIYQKVTFSKAKLLFSDGLYDQAIVWFNNSLKYPIDPSIADQAHFLKAESHFSLSDFNLAIQSYRSIKVPSAQVSYGLGYAYYNLFEYRQALEYFDQYVKTNPSLTNLNVDAKLRLADCLYATKSYRRSLELYKEVYRYNASATTLFQIGLVEYSLGLDEEALETLQRVLKGSDEAFQDDAVFEIGNIHFENASFELAASAYTQLIGNYSDSPFRGRAFLNRGVCMSNLGRLEEARNDYESVVQNFTTEPSALDAILGLQELEQQGTRVNNLNALIKTYKEANPEDTSIEAVEFESAKAAYFQLNYESAIASFNNFLKEYPKSSFGLEASYYLGDAYYRTGQLEKAREIFTELGPTRNNLTGRIFFRLGDIHYQLEDYEDAIKSYEMLKDVARTPKDVHNARVGMLNSYYRLGKYQEGLSMAEEIVAAEWKPINGQRLALLMKGKCLYQLAELAGATEAFNEAANDSDVIAAEASYWMALILHDQSTYEESNEKLFELNQKFGSYAQWIDKSYLLIADNYIATDAVFQAKATLRSIMLHSSDEDIKSRAADKLALIEDNPEMDSLKTQGN